MNRKTKRNKGKNAIFYHQNRNAIALISSIITLASGLRLRDRQFNPGAIDGLFGENTEATVKAFQRSVGLEADGIVEIETRTRL